MTEQQELCSILLDFDIDESIPIEIESHVGGNDNEVRKC